MEPLPDSTVAETAARILLAEDHPDSRDALSALLEAFGYRVLLATDGRTAVELARAEAPDLILMDIMMPELDGFQAIRRLRRHDATSGIPIIAITALDNAERLAYQAGATDFLRKPLDTALLLERVGHWLERKVHCVSAKRSARVRVH